MKNLLILIIIIGAIIYAFSPGNVGFTDADIANVKKSIKEKFEEQPGNYRVTGLEMIRESSTKLTGFATLKINDTIDITKTCNAVYGDGKYIWRCQ